MAKTLTGKVALVTGGSRGLGAATSAALADAGADVAISYVASAEKAAAVVEALKAKGVRAVAIQADQGDPTASAPLMRHVVEVLGKLDILVNNAAVAWQGKTIDDPEIDNAAMDRQWMINAMGVVANIRAAARVMPDGGRIISVGSGLGTRVAFPGTTDYAATKAAVIGYSRGAARDLGRRNITVNVVQAGLMDTDMAARSKQGQAAADHHGLARDRAFRLSDRGRRCHCLPRRARRRVHHGLDHRRQRRLHRLSAAVTACRSANRRRRFRFERSCGS